MYLGEINHRGKSFPAEHEPIIEKEVFDAVQNILNENPNRHDTGYNRSDALLVGLLFDDRGNRMSPSHAKKKGVRYNYYVSTPAIQGRKQDFRECLSGSSQGNRRGRHRCTASKKQPSDVA